MPCLLYGRGSAARRGVSSIHSFINHPSMRRPWPIGQLHPPDTPGLIKKAQDNGITGQINDPLMKSPTKQAKTARPTYVFHHAVALTFPLAPPPRQAQLGTGRHRESGAEWEKKRRKMTRCSDTAKPPHPRPLSDFWPNKSICCHTAPLRPPLTHTCTLRPGERLKKAAPGRMQLRLLTLWHKPFVQPIPGASPSIFVSQGQIERERISVWQSGREGHRTAAAG